MHSPEQLEPMPAAASETPELPEFESVEAGHEWLREQRLTVLAGYAEARMKELNAPTITERCKTEIMNAVNGSNVDRVRYFAALSCAVMAGIYFLEGQHSQALKYGSAREILLTPEWLRIGATAARAHFPEIASYLEAGGAFLNEKKEILEMAAQKAIDILGNEVIITNLNG